MEGSTSRARSGGGRPSPSGSREARKVVLVADDQLNVRNILEFNLKRRGYDVQVVHDGPSVLSTASAAAPDLILLDIMMPGLDGFQVLERLRAHPETEGIPVLIVSARGSEGDILRALQLGARDYVVKPFNLEVLFEKITRALEGPVAPGEAAAGVAAAALVSVSSLDAPMIPALARRTNGLARAGAEVVIVDLSGAPLPVRDVLQRLVRMRDDLSREGSTLRLVGDEKLRAALDSLELATPLPAFSDVASALAGRLPA